MKPARGPLLVLILAVLVGVVPSACPAGESGFDPVFYPFRNGLRFESPAAGVKFLKELGYPGVGSVYPRDLAAYKKACEAEGLKIISIYCGSKVNADGFSYGPEVDAAIALLEGTDALVELNVQRGKDPNDEQAVALVREVAGKAKKAGLKVVLYPHANFHIERVDHAVRIARASGCDNVGVIFNLCHFLKVQPDSDLRASLEDARDYLWAVSTCGADAEGKDWKTLIRPLDEGSFDQVLFLRHLRELGFSGPVGLQCYNIRVPSKDHLSRSLKAWKRLLGESLLEKP